MPNFNDVQNILKTTYGRALENQLNEAASPILANIKSVPVGGKEFTVGATYGINGGPGFRNSGEQLPQAGGQQYKDFTSKVKLLFAPIEFEDVAWRASQSNMHAFFDIARKEFESAETALKFNLGRSVYGDGSGKLATISKAGTNTTTVTFTDTQYLVEGLICDIFASGGVTPTTEHARILSVDRGTNTVTFDKAIASAQEGGFVTLQGSFNNELTGFAKIFEKTGTLYGVDKATNAWMIPYSQEATASETISDDMIFDVLATLQMHRGAETDLIVCGYKAYKAYAEHLREYNKRIENNLELKGGFKAMSVAFDGRDIPLIMDRFAPSNEAIMLETKKLGLYGIGGWDWLTYGDGSIIQRLPDKPVYQAVMSRYCDLLCEHPGGIGRITNCDGTDAA